MTPPTAEVADSDRPQRRILYGRRKGRKLRPSQAALIEGLLPKIEIEPGDGPLDPASLFEFDPEDVWLEIGFGAGEHLLAQASENSRAGFIGCEPYLNGVVKLLSGLRDLGLGNIRVSRDDARMLLARLPGSSLGRAFILFPDPWPKSRHHKRRMVSRPVLDRLAFCLKPGAELRIATDDRGYLVWILRHVLQHGAFEWLARRPMDWRHRPEDWPQTRYEAKAIAAGRSCAYLRFLRCEDGGTG